MDEGRLNTGDVLAMGILNVSPPKTEIPEDREEIGSEDEEWNFIGVAAVAEAVDAGKIVSALNYYGIPHVWKASEGVYRGTLLQYRAITEDKTFATASEVAEWFEECYYSTNG